MANKPNKKSIGNGQAVGFSTPKTPDDKRKSNTKPGTPMPVMGIKKPAPTPAKMELTPFKGKKENTPAKGTPGGGGGGKPQGISQQFNKISDKSKAINKNKNKQNKGKGGAPSGGGGFSPKNPNQQEKPKVEGQAKNAPIGPVVSSKKASKKNRRQRIQAKLDAKPRNQLAQSRALKAEQEMYKTANKTLIVTLPDEPITTEAIKKWSPNVGTVLFHKSIYARSFQVVLKPNANVKKEIETLSKVNFGGKKLKVEERKGELDSAVDLIDPYTLYLTNLDEAVTKQDLQKLFPAANPRSILNPKKHKMRGGGGPDQENTKFAFVGFDSPDQALEGFKASHNKDFMGEKCIIVRFRRDSKNKGQTGETESETEKKTEKEGGVAAAATKRKSETQEPTPKKGQAKPDVKKIKMIKEEPEEDDDEDDDDEDDDDEEDDESDEDIMKGGKMKMGIAMAEDDDDDDEDDDDDGLDDDDDDEDDDMDEDD